MDSLAQFNKWSSMGPTVSAPYERVEGKPHLFFRRAYWRTSWYEVEGSSGITENRYYEAALWAGAMGIFSERNLPIDSALLSTDECLAIFGYGLDRKRDRIYRKRRSYR